MSSHWVFLLLLPIQIYIPYSDGSALLLYISTDRQTDRLVEQVTFWSFYSCCCCCCYWISTSTTLEALVAEQIGEEWDKEEEILLLGKLQTRSGCAESETQMRRGFSFFYFFYYYFIPSFQWASSSSSRLYLLTEEEEERHKHMTLATACAMQRTEQEDPTHTDTYTHYIVLCSFATLLF